MKFELHQMSPTYAVIYLIYTVHGESHVLRIQAM